jgi:hypothetical protein
MKKKEKKKEEKNKKGKGKEMRRKVKIKTVERILTLEVGAFLSPGVTLLFPKVRNPFFLFLL